MLAAAKIVNRENLEYILRAAAAITRKNRLLIIGSQSILVLAAGSERRTLAFDVYR